VPQQEQRLGKARRSPLGPCGPQAEADMDMERGTSHAQQGMDKAARGHRPHLPISLALCPSSFSPLLSSLPHQ